MRKNLLLFFLLLLVAPSVLIAHNTNNEGQEIQAGQSAKTITGQVNDVNGEPEIGAIVQIKGTDVRTVTDVNGRFSIRTLQSNPILIISSIGRLTVEHQLGNESSVSITLHEDVKTLKDVVVTGYQVISKERATGSFSKVSDEDLKGKRYGNLSQMLEGEIAGFNTSSAIIRGTTSMNGVTNPLYVIDGFPVENTRYNDYGSLKESIPNINVEDIESITVLKDAAAASIYGARAANGVVVIETKKAKGNKTSVSVNASLTYHPYSMNESRLTDSYDIIGLEKEWAANNPNLSGTNSATYAASLLANNAYTSAGIRSILNYHTGNITEGEMNSKLSSLAGNGYRYYDDVAKYAKRGALYQQYNISIGKASTHNNFRMSLSFRSNKLNDKYSNDRSFAVDLKDILDITPWLTLEFGNYTNFKKAQTQTFDLFSPGYNYLPYDQLKNEDGTNYTKSMSERLSQSTLNIINNNGLYSMDITPLDEISRNLNKENYFTNRTYGKLNVTFTPYLKYNIMFEYEYGTDKGKLLYDKESYYVRNLVNQYATSDGTTTTFNLPYGNILRRVEQTSKASTFRHQLNLDKTFGQLHNITMLLGHEVRRSVLEYNRTTLFNYSDDMLSYSLVNQAVLSNTSGLLGGYGMSASDFAYIRYIDNRFISFYANAAYSYDDRYMATASIRWDRSNLWGTSSKYQRKPIWSLGAGWNIDKEQWFDVSWINRLKLRVSHGIAGNIAKDAAPYMTASYNNNTHVGGIYGSISTRPNPTLRWEKTTTTNIGLDFSILRNRLGGSIEYYNKNGTDLLANTMGVPTEGYGYSTYKINNGEMRNRGYEITLHGNIIKKRNIDFNASITYSHNNNKVKYVNVKAPVYYLQLDYPTAYPIIGNPYNAIYAYRWAGLSSEGLPQVYDADGNATTSNPSSLDAIVYAGSTEPTDLASLNLSFRYKDFDFSCLWIYQGGHKMRNTSIPMLDNAYNSALRSYVTTIGPTNKDIAQRWQATGDESRTQVPRAVFAEDPVFSSNLYTIYSYADINVIDASNLRLANISLAYRLPQNFLKKIYLYTARVQINIENVCTFAHSKSAKYLLGGYNAPNYTLGLYLDL